MSARRVGTRGCKPAPYTDRSLAQQEKSCSDRLTVQKERREPRGGSDQLVRVFVAIFTSNGDLNPCFADFIEVHVLGGEVRRRKNINSVISNY